MLKITLSKFTEFTVKDIHKFLLQQKETVFKITIPRQAIIVRQDYVVAMVNYLSVAYAGQLLSKIANSFAYYVPCPTRKTSFYFLVVIPDKEKFAETLYLIIQCFNSNTKEENLLISVIQFPTLPFPSPSYPVSKVNHTDRHITRMRV